MTDSELKFDGAEPLSFEKDNPIDVKKEEEKKDETKKDSKPAAKSTAKSTKSKSKKSSNSKRKKAQTAESIKENPKSVAQQKSEAAQTGRQADIVRDEYTKEGEINRTTSPGPTFGLDSPRPGSEATKKKAVEQQKTPEQEYYKEGETNPSAPPARS